MLLQWNEALTQLQQSLTRISLTAHYQSNGKRSSSSASPSAGGSKPSALRWLWWQPSKLCMHRPSSSCWQPAS